MGRRRIRQNPMRTFPTGFGAAVVFAFALSASAGTARKEFLEACDFAPGGYLRVENVNGNITVEAWDEERAEVYAEIEVKARTLAEAEAFLKEVEILVDHDRNRVAVETDVPGFREESLWEAIFSGRRKPRVSVRYRIRVPARADLTLESVNGRIGVFDVEGTARLATTNGGIDARNVKGSVDARTTNGGIGVELSAVDEGEDMRLKTTNGGIELVLPGEIRADIAASTVNGSVSTDFPIKFHGKISRKRVRGSVNGGGGSIDLHTVNGSIRIRER